MFEFLTLEFMANLLGVGSVVAAVTAGTYRYMEGRTLRWVYVRLIVGGNTHTWVRIPSREFTRGELMGVLSTLSVDAKARVDFGFLNVDSVYVAMRKHVKVFDIPLTAEQACIFRAKAWVDNPED